MKLNVELLERVKKEILAEPRKVNMRTWLGRKSSTDRMTKIEWEDYGTANPPCGTVGCIAGWMAVLANPKRKLKQEDVSTLASTALGADDYGLFWVDQWPFELQVQLEAAKPGTKKYAQIVARRIDLFIKEYKDKKDEDLPM